MNITGIFLDQKYGLLFIFPYIIFLPAAGFYLCIKKIKNQSSNIKFTGFLIISIVLHIIFISSQTLASWTAGSAIAGRYSVFLMPEFIILIFYFIFNFKNLFFKTFTFFFILHSILLFYILNLFHRLKFNSGHHTSQFIYYIEKSFGEFISPFLPYCSDDRINANTYIFTAAIILLNIAIITILFLTHSEKKKNYN